MNKLQWDECYHQFQRLALRTAWTMLYTLEDVQDAVQEAFSAVWRRRHDLADADEYRRYLLGAVVNQCRKHRRNYLRQPDEYSAGPAEAPGTPEDEALKRELRAKVRKAVAALPEEQAESVVLCLVEGLSYEEAAQAMGTTVPALRNHLYRARKALRENLEDLLG